MTGRQRPYTNLLVCEVCSPSCTETFTSANTRAVSTSDSWRSRATSRTMAFQIDRKFVAVPEPLAPMPAHSRAIAVCSGVRVALFERPFRLTSFNSVA